MVKIMETRTEDRVIELGFPVEYKVTKLEDHRWRVVVEAVGNRPEFKGIADSKGTAVYQVQCAFSQYVKGLVHKMEETQ